MPQRWTLRSNLKLRRVNVVAPRHAVIAQHELRQKGKKEAYENNDGRQPRPLLGIHSPGHFWPPVVQPGHVAHYHAADHNEMEMGNHEIRIMHMYVDAQVGQEEPRHAAEGEQGHKSRANSIGASNVIEPL